MVNENNEQKTSFVDDKKINLLNKSIPNLKTNNVLGEHVTPKERFQIIKLFTKVSSKGVLQGKREADSKSQDEDKDVQKKRQKYKKTNC